MIAPTDRPGPPDRDFGKAITSAGCKPLRHGPIHTLQVNLGKRCNQACLHCHVEAGPKRTEMMSREVAERTMELLADAPSTRVLDITGGAPELNPNFRAMVEQATALSKEVIDRCNLTIFFEPGMESLPGFLAAHGVRVVASLPCYSLKNVDAQRGKGSFDKSIRGLQRLNQLGYGAPGSGLILDLVYNPGGAFLPPPQRPLEARYREELHTAFGIQFNSLLTLTNLPVNRFADSLERAGHLEGYLDLLVNSFNGKTIGGLMCRSQISVSWDGKLYDCDFNQMLGMECALDVSSIGSLAELEGLPIQTAPHCFGCTAGAGSSCGGALS